MNTKVNEKMVLSDKEITEYQNRIKKRVEFLKKYNASKINHNESYMNFNRMLITQ